MGIPKSIADHFGIGPVSLFQAGFLISGIMFDFMEHKSLSSSEVLLLCCVLHIDRVVVLLSTLSSLSVWRPYFPIGM